MRDELNEAFLEAGFSDIRWQIPDKSSYFQPVVTAGKKSYKQHSLETFASFPDFARAIDDTVAEGDKVSVRCTMRGTHKNGKVITSTSFIIYRLVGGRIAELWVLHDRFGIYQQLGVLPPIQEIVK